jgi:hypothetical protein
MIVFLDCEFTHFIDCGLISIGLVSECGQHEFYAERTDFERVWCCSFVEHEVFTMLGRDINARMTREQLHVMLWSWLGKLGDVYIAYDYASDWDLLMDALVDFRQAKRPANIIGRIDLRQYMFDSIYTKAMNHFYTPEFPPHYALADAKAHRAGWLAWQATQPTA